jgi:GT2 family glycosyltransferase
VGLTATAETVVEAAETTGAATGYDLSVVIVNWNTRRLLEDCLSSLFDSLKGVRTEVHVVDNASSDDSVAMVRERFPQVRLTVNPDNRGFAVANNQALRECAGRYLLLLNSDTVVPPGVPDALVSAMDERPDAAVCSPLLLNADGSPQICWSRFPGLTSELRGELDRGQSPYPLADYADPARRAEMPPFPVDWVGGACFLVRASDADAVGLMDESYFMYSEETDWCLRFRRAGRAVLLVPSVTVTHLGGGSSRAVPLATRERIWRSGLRFYGKAYGPVGALPARFVATARFLLFHVKRRLTGGGAK